MAIMVFLKDGKDVTLPTATKVAASHFPTSRGSMGQNPDRYDALACQDDQDKVVGMFRAEDVAGYRITE